MSGSVYKIIDRLLGYPKYGSRANKGIQKKEPV
jgi:hypothetical protein